MQERKFFACVADRYRCDWQPAEYTERGEIYCHSGHPQGDVSQLHCCLRRKGSSARIGTVGRLVFE